MSDAKPRLGHIRTYIIGSPDEEHILVIVDRCLSLIPRISVDGRFLFLRPGYRVMKSRHIGSTTYGLVTQWHDDDPGPDTHLGMSYIQEGRDPGRFLP